MLKKIEGKNDMKGYEYRPPMLMLIILVDVVSVEPKGRGSHSKYLYELAVAFS